MAEPGWIDAARPRAGLPRRGPGWRRRLVRSAGHGRPVRGGLGWAVALLVLLTLYAVVVPAVLGIDERLVFYDAAQQPPSWDHPFGTDLHGRDLFGRVALGVRISLLIAVTCAVLSAVIGTLVGVLAGLTGGWVDRIVMRAVDAANAVPHLLLGIVIVALYRGSVVAIIASIALTHWTQVARIVRAEVLTLREREYVDAAISAGATRWQTARRHVLPAVVPQAVLSAVLLLPHAVWHESALSFLGLGMPPHRASLGTLLQESREALLLGSWWTLVVPSLLLVLATLAIAACGAAWRDRVLPRRRSELTP